MTLAGLGALATGKKPGRETPAERTMTANLGLAMDDMAVTTQPAGIQRKTTLEGNGKFLVLFDDKGRYLNSVGFDIFGADAVIADERIGHGDHLSVVGRVCQDFLVPGHAGVKNHFSRRFSLTGKTFAGEGSAVFQG